MKRVWFDQDREYLRSLEDERNYLTCPVGHYYSLKRGKNVDPLYNEPMYWEYMDPVELRIAIVYQPMDNREPGVQEEGETIEADAEMYVSYNEWRRKFGDNVVPKEGDVVAIFDTGYENEGWFDVRKVGSGGHIVDTVSYTGWKLECKRRKKFDPRRKV